jgi:pimeloyl-ACP methyl ester carboxylesterase
VFVVGHDWGALVAWHLSLFRPDLVRAVLNIGVPYFPRGPTPMTESFAALGDGFYIVHLELHDVCRSSSSSRLLHRAVLLH